MSGYWLACPVLGSMKLILDSGFIDLLPSP